MDPTKTALHSGKKAYWRCRTCGYEWQAVIASCSDGRGCPKCSNRLPRRIKNLATGEIYNSINDAAKQLHMGKEKILEICGKSGGLIEGAFLEYVELKESK